MQKFLTLVSWLVAGVLIIFTARRWFFLSWALLADKPVPQPVHLPPEVPEVLLLAPVRNEALALPEFLPALAGLDYPAEKLTVVLINDGSTDGSEALIRNWIYGRYNWHFLSLPKSVGKAQALNLALAQFPQGELVAIYDADERPQPEALSTLIGPFTDPQVGGVSGRRAVSNALASPAASYTTFEGLVHQWVTLLAKDKLNLAPAILGANCVYRRSALAQAGNFKPGALLEDSDLTLKLARAGWKIRFEPQAVSYHAVPRTVRGYWRQHTRWARGFNEVAKTQAPAILFDQQLPLFLRLELLAFALGYLDRLALLVGAGLILVLGRRARANTSPAGSPPSFDIRRNREILPAVVAILKGIEAKSILGGMVAVSLLTPLFQIMTALRLSRQPPALWWRMIWVPVFFIVDIAMAVTGLGGALKQAPQIWEERRARS